MSYMKKERLSLEQAAAALGKCPRQVRRFVASGQLPATGGGRGVALVFDRADVLAFKARVAYAPRRAWKGRVDAEGLARIAHALKLDPAGTSYMARGLLALWQVKRALASAIINSMPPVEKVPPSTLAWAQGVAEKLSPAEIDFVAAMFIRRGNPDCSLDFSERAALGRAADLIKAARPHLFRSETDFQQSPEEWGAVEGSIRASLADYDWPTQKAALEMRREQFFDPARRQIAWELYSEHRPLISTVTRFHDAVRKGDVEETRRLVHTSRADRADGVLAPYPEADEVGYSLTGLARKCRNLRRASGRAPTCRQVSRLLGIHHQQGTRLAESIMRQLGPAGFSALWFERLGLDDVEIARSRLWRRALRDTVPRPAAARPQVRRADTIDEEADDVTEIAAMMNENANFMRGFFG